MSRVAGKPMVMGLADLQTTDPLTLVLLVFIAVGVLVILIARH